MKEDMTHGATYVPGYTAGNWTIDPTESPVSFVAVIPCGVETVAGDLTDPLSLRPALTDVEQIFLYSPADSTTGTAAVVHERRT
jgi:uncharacterized protein YbjT (DUF2867 family)